MNINIDIEQYVLNVLDWLATNGLKIAFVLLIAEILSHFAKIIIGRFVKHLLNAKDYPTEVDRSQRAKTLNGIFTTTARLVIWFMALLFILVQLGVDVTAIIAGAGFMGLAFGIGAQSFINDITSGVFMIIENQYRVGDFVELNGQSGRVEDITMRVTRIRDLDGNVHYISNGQIKMSTNKSMEYSKIVLKIGVSYSSDIDKVEKVINKVGLEMMKDKDLKDKIETPLKFTRVSDFGDSSVEVMISGKVKPGKQWGVAGEFRRRIKKAFDKEKIEIPFPQVDLHTKNP